MAMTRQLDQPGSASRYRKLTLRCVLALACAGLAAGCGSTPAPSHTAANGGKGTTSAAKVSLDVTISGSPTAGRQHWTLRCDPAGGTLPDAATACASLAKLKTLFEPQPVGVMCPMIMRDAGTATVTGFWYGRPVHQVIFDGSCDLGKWNLLHQIFN
jgi:hypothetical protein